MSAVGVTSASPAQQLLADLRQLHTLTFSALSAKATGWNGQGHGEVSIETLSPDSIVFHETGQWQPTGREDRPALQFRNTYRWTLVDAQTVRLEHLRLGPDQPVFLVDLVPGVSGASASWTNTAPHQCSADLYALSLHMRPSGIDMHWRITGPKKDESLAYAYEVRA